MVQQFTVTVRPSNGDYSSLNAAATGLANDITAADIKVFSISAYSTPTIAAGDTVLGQSSGATGVCVLVNFARSQILIKTIAVFAFQSGEVVQKTADANVNVTLSNAGDSPMIGIECYSMSDTTAVNITTPWVTSATNYLRIYTPISERHLGTWNDTKYRLEIASASNTRAITCNIAYACIDGLQISVDSTSTNYADAIGFTLSTASSYIITSNCIIKGINDNYGSGIYVVNNTGYIYNNMIYDFTGSTSYGLYSNTGTALYVYNNTLINCDYGLRGTAFLYAKNNIFRSNALAPTTNMTAANCGYNATDAASLGYTAQTGDRVSQTFAFVNEIGYDFHLSAIDTGARNFGLTDPSSGVFLDDIDGNTRPGQLIWDIGADEYFPTGGNRGYITG